MHKRPIAVTHNEAYDEILARSENDHIDYIDGAQIRSMSLDNAYHLVLTGNVVAYTCGPIGFDLCVVSNVNSIYYFKVPHPDTRQEQP